MFPSTPLPPPTREADGLPFDPTGLARQLRLAFQARAGGGFEAAGPALKISVDARAFTVRTADVEQTTFRTRAVRRGARALLPGAELHRDARGQLELVGAEHREHLENGLRGLEQSWAFDHLPAGTGALTVEVAVEGTLREATAAGFHFASNLTYGHATWVDAAGRRTPIVGRWVGDGIAFEVPEALLHASRFPAVLDPLVSAEFDVDSPVAVPAFGDQLSPAVAWSGSQYLLAWNSADRLSGLQDVLVARLDVSGNLIDPFGITVGTGADTIDGLAVASNGSGFFVTWHETVGSTNRLRGARLSAAGTLLDATPITVASPAGATLSRPRVAHAGTVYLVVWDDSRDGDRDVYGTRVDAANGAVLDGNGFVVCGQATFEANPVVDSTGSEFLVAWEDGRGGAHDLYAARVTTGGAVLNTNGFLVTSAAATQTELALAWNGATHLLTWSDFRTFTRYEVYGALITAAGVVLPDTTTNIAIATGGVSRYTPSVSAFGTHATGAPFIVTWLDNRNSTPDIYGARVSDGGAVLDPSHLWLVDAGASQDSPTVAAGGTSAFVAWIDRRSSARDVWGEPLTPAGVMGTAANKSWFANEQWEPAVASSGSMYFVVWADHRFSNGSLSPSAIFGARVSDAGVSLDPGGILISSVAGASPRTPEVTWVAQANQFMVAWVDDRDGGHNLYGARVTAAGANLDPNGVVISSAPAMQNEPALASDGTQALVAWSDARNQGTNGRDVYAAFFLPDGGVSPGAATGFPIVSLLSDQDQPAVAWNGSDYLVAWADGRSIANGRDVYATRVTPTGTVRDMGGVVLTGTSAQSAPAAAAVGTTFLVTWQDDRAGAGLLDIYGARLNPTGASLVNLDTSGGFAIATGSEYQRAPSLAADGTNFLVAWQSSAASGITNSTRGARVSPAGVVLDVNPGFSISPGVVDYGSIAPQVAAGGPRTFLATSWTAMMPPGPGMGGRVRARLITNTPPSATALNASTQEDTAGVIVLSGGDADGDALTWAVQAAPAHGALSGTPPSLTYTPVANYNGPDSFTFTSNDGAATSAPATVSITVTAVNDAPVAQSQSVSTPEDVSRAITLTATDLDSASLSYAVVAAPSNGMLGGTPPNLTYTPSLNFSGVDTFTFRASDGAENSNTATVTITVTAVNDAPVAQNQSPTTNEDTARAITLVATDVDSASLTYAIVSPPSNGALSGTPPNVTYTPTPNFSGSDSFTFRANDGLTDSNVAVVTLTVVAVNDAPVATGANLQTPQDTQLQVTLQASDLETGLLTYTIVSQPSHGTISAGTGAVRTYTPTAGYVGLDSFTFRASDGQLDSNVATITVDVGAVNHAPVATPQGVSTAEDSPRAITLAGTDQDGNPLTFTVLSNPLHGTLSGTPPTVTYTPNANYAGPDSFTFKANDGAFDSAMAATVSITVTPVNDAPVANASSVSVSEDSMVTITLSGNDVDADPLTLVVVTQPLHGALTGTPPNVTYTPSPDYVGLDAITFRANDGTVDSAPAQVLITVTQVNDAPVAQPQMLATPQDTPLNILLTGTDVDGNLLTFSIVTQPANGTLSGSPPNITYTPRAGYRGNDTFTFKATDGLADSMPAAIGISVAAVNHAPVATSQHLTTPEDQALAITLAGTDQDSDPLTYAVVVQPSHGTISGTPPNVTYTPEPNFNGIDTIQFRANDGVTDSTDGTIRVTVSPVDDAPTAQAQTITTSEDAPVSIVLAGADPDGTTPAFALTAMPTHGTLTGNAPNLNYTPEPDYFGADSLQYSVTDGASTAMATVDIIIAPVNDAPTVAPIQASTVEGSPVTVTLRGEDLEGAALTFAVAAEPGHGTLSGTPPELTYTPEAGFSGTDTFTYTANDGVATSQAATVTLTVTPATGNTRDTTRINGWSCGCSTGSGGSASAWLMGLGLVLVAARRRRSSRRMRALALSLPLVMATLAQAAPAKAKKGKAAPAKTAPAPVPTPEPVVTPAPPPPVEVKPEPAPAPPVPKGPPSLATLDVVISVPNEKLDGAAFTEMLTAAVDQSKLYRVISAREVATMIGLEREKALLGCSDDTSCLTELADALGSDFVLQGTIGKVGDTYLVTVRLIDSKKSRVVGRAANQSADPNLLLNLIWKSTQQTLDAWGATLSPEDAKRVASRPQVEPAAAVAPPTSRIGVIATAVGSYQPLAPEGSRASVGGEVAAAWRFGRLDLGAGVVISPTPGGRVFVTFALLPGDNRISLGVRGSGFPTASTWGGGVIAEYERALGRYFALRVHVAPEAYGSPNGLVFALLGGVGAAARF